MATLRLHSVKVKTLQLTKASGRQMANFFTSISLVWDVFFFFFVGSLWKACLSSPEAKGPRDTLSRSKGPGHEDSLMGFDNKNIKI